jgi:magnesium transporter
MLLSYLATMFRVIDLRTDGTLAVVHDVSVTSHLIAIPPAGTTRWIDLQHPDAAALEHLRSAFAFHPLAIADCAAYGRQSRLDDYSDYLFAVSHAFTRATHDPLLIQVHEIHAFIAECFLVTVHDNPIPAHEQVWTTACTQASVLAKGPSWPWLTSVQAMVDASEPLVMSLAEELDIMERDVIEEGADIDLSETFRIKRSAVAMRRVLRPLRDSLTLVVEIAEDTDPKIPNRAAQYITALRDRVVRLTEAVEEAREVANGIVSGYHAVQSTKTNAVMKRLTIFSVFFLPLSFIVGFWGQNFTTLPISDAWAWWSMLVSLVVTPIVLLAWIRRRWM